MLLLHLIFTTVNQFLFVVPVLPVVPKMFYCSMAVSCFKAGLMILKKINKFVNSFALMCQVQQNFVSWTVPETIT